MHARFVVRDAIIPELTAVSKRVIVKCGEPAPPVLQTIETRYVVRQFSAESLARRG